MGWKARIADADGDALLPYCAVPAPQITAGNVLLGEAGRMTFRDKGHARKCKEKKRKIVAGELGPMKPPSSSLYFFPSIIPPPSLFSPSFLFLFRFGPFTYTVIPGSQPPFFVID